MMDNSSPHHPPWHYSNRFAREAETISKRREKSAHHLCNDFQFERDQPEAMEFPPIVLDLRVFELCNHWLHTNELLSDTGSDDLDLYKNNTRPSRQAIGELISEEQRNLTALWFVAGWWGFPTLQNLVVDRILEIHENSSDILQETIRPIVEHTVIGSPLRRLYVDIYARDLAMKAVMEYPKYYPKAFMAETMVAMEQLFTEYQGRYKPLAPSDYHVGLGNDRPWM